MDFAVARVMVRVLVCGWRAASVRLLAVALSLSERLEESDGHETTRIGQRRVAGFVPVGIVFSADDVEEVAFGEAQLLG